MIFDLPVNPLKRTAFRKKQGGYPPKVRPLCPWQRLAWPTGPPPRPLGWVWRAHTPATTGGTPKWGSRHPRRTREKSKTDYSVKKRARGAKLHRDVRSCGQGCMLDPLGRPWAALRGPTTSSLPSWPFNAAESGPRTRYPPPPALAGKARRQHAQAWAPARRPLPWRSYQTTLA